MALSYTSLTDFNKCKKFYKYRRILKIYNKNKGASLPFGSIIDSVINGILETIQETKEPGDIENWKKMFLEYEPKNKYDASGWNLIYDDPHVYYTNSDWDNVLISEIETDLVKEWEKELDITLAEIKKAIKMSSHKKMTKKEKKFFHRMCWLTLKNIGLMMIESFYAYVLPQLTEIIAVQHKIEGVVGDKKLVGYIDNIATFEGKDIKGRTVSRPVVFDIKTAGKEYDNMKLTLSKQLILYLSAVMEELDTNYIGYIVLLKNLPKKYVCTKCGKERPKSGTGSRGKKCAKCDTTYDIQLDMPKPQIIVDTVPREKVKRYLDMIARDSHLLKIAEENDLLDVENWDRCMDYNRPCDYMNICFPELGKPKKKDFENLDNLKKEEK